MEDEYIETPLTRGVKELVAALPEYERAESYYNGEVEEYFAHWRIEKYIGETKNRYRLNFARKAVDVIADRLEIASVVVPDNETQTKLLNKIYKKNRMHRKGRTIHRRTAMFGDAYLFVWPENPDNPNIKFDVHFNSPKTTRAIYSREHPDKIEYVIKLWPEAGPLGLKLWRANLYYPEHLEKWISNYNSGRKTTANAVSGEADASGPQDKPPLDPDRWDEYADPEEDGASTIPNPFKTIPIFHFRNDEPYGRPRHHDAYGAQDALNKLSTTLVHSIDFQGFPQRYGLADPAATVGGAGDNTTPWDDDDDDTGATSDSGVESGPGTFIRLEGIRAAGSFPAASPDVFMDPGRFYLRSMAQITTTPLRFFDPIGEPPSGEALRAMDAPLNRDAMDFADILEETWADVYEFMLRTLSKNVNIKDRAKSDPDDPDDGLQVDVQWKPVVTIDDAMGWDTVKKKIDAGVPARQALTEAGYSKRQVDEWMKENESRINLNRDSEILSRLAASARDLSQAVHEGIMDPGVTQHILTTMMEKLLNEQLPEPKIKEKPLVERQPPLPENQKPTEEADEAETEKGDSDGNKQPLNGGAPDSREERGRATSEALRRLATLPNR